MSRIFDERRCILGEGPLWHPGRRQLYWFDIEAGQMLTREDGRPRHWDLGEMASAAGWIDDERLLIATERRLMRFDLRTGGRQTVVELEADNDATRSNDGRADPWGGFWIGTMRKEGGHGGGAIYRYWQGELRCLHDSWTIPNAICFTPDRAFAHLTDTPNQRILRQPLDPETGWPADAAVTWLDLSGAGLYPDGAVTDAAGDLWCAMFGGGRVVRYGSDGAVRQTIELGAGQTTCPAFGGSDMTTLYCTSAARDRDEDEADRGRTFVVEGAGHGRAEPRVVL